MDISNQVISITVEFSQGSFAEWAGANGETYPTAFVDEWESNYNAVITKKLQAGYPNASIEVGEGNDQMMHTRINFELSDAGYEEHADEYEYEIKQAIIDCLDVDADQDEIWKDPSVDAIQAAIDTLTTEKPIGKIEYGNSRFAFSQMVDHRYYWIDLVIEEDPLGADIEWKSGTLRDAAEAFKNDIS